MRIRTLIICLSIILIISVALNIFLLVKSEDTSLFITVSKPLSFNEAGEMESSYGTIVDDRKKTEIVLLSMINAQPIQEEEYPTTLPDCQVWVRYGGTAYPYKLWFYEDYIIFGNDSNVFRKIQNDHNNPVQIIKDLVNSISTTSPG